MWEKQLGNKIYNINWAESYAQILNVLNTVMLLSLSLKLYIIYFHVESNYAIRITIIVDYVFILVKQKI